MVLRGRAGTLQSGEAFRVNFGPEVIADLHRRIDATRWPDMALDAGHERYGVQGGDWGAIIGTQLALRHPESVAGLHLNFVASLTPPPPAGTEPGAQEREYREQRARFQAEETGYSSIQGTRPQTLSYAQPAPRPGFLAALHETPTPPQSTGPALYWVFPSWQWRSARGSAA